MSFLTILLIVATVAVILYMYRSSKQNSANKPPAQAQSQALTIENVGPGGGFSIAGVGPNLEDIDVVVAAKHTYRQGNFRWYELECNAGGDTYFVEIEKDDELDISITLKKLKLSDIGVSKSELEKIDDTEEGSVTYDGVRYSYEDSGEAHFLRNGDPQDDEKFYFWDFESEEQQKYVSVEKWSDGSYEASYGEWIEPSQITVFSLQGSAQ